MIGRSYRDESWISWLEGHLDGAQRTTSGIFYAGDVYVLLFCPDSKPSSCVRGRVLFVQINVRPSVAVVPLSEIGWTFFQPLGPR